MSIYNLQHCRRPATIFISLTGVICILLFVKHHDNQKTHRQTSSIKRRNTSNNDNYLSKQDEDINSYKEDLLLRIEDLKRIKLSLRNELLSIEKDKSNLLKEKSTLISKNEKLQAQINRSKAQLKQFDLDISANRKQKFEKNCDIERISPIIFNPMRSVNLRRYSYDLLNSDNPQDIDTIPQIFRHNQFDYSQCSLAKDFKFHLVLTPTTHEYVEENHISNYKSVIEILKSHPQQTNDVEDACIVVLVKDSKFLNLTKDKNVLIISDSFSEIGTDTPKNVALASSSFHKNAYRDGFDIILPSIWQPASNYGSIIGAMSPHTPVYKKYLASYFGQEVVDRDERKYLKSLENSLQIIHRNSIDDLFLFNYDCGQTSEFSCYHEKEKMVGLSSFTIILISSETFIDGYANDMLYLALSKGAIPVVVGKERTKLPFSDVLDWRKASILLPTARLPELHFLLRSIDVADLYQLRYHGRRIFERYLATIKQILYATISVISVERFGYPPMAVEGVKTISFHDTSKIIYDSNCTSPQCQDAKTESINSILNNEILGPREKPHPSLTFRRNFSLVLNSAYELWNNPFYSPQELYPSNPIDPVPPSEYKYLSAGTNYRPINDGLGGSGVEFSRSLGGDYPNEQFTIVLLTYERNSLLLKTIERMKGLAYLNKIIVVWNGIKHEPSKDMLWPDVGVPIIVVKSKRNSLNNRFIPYDSIETDAILSLDDDSPLRQDEIVFGFRVWRESRDRIVGFPGRFHAWNRYQNSWYYNSNHSCELSMVLTGGAFFHKYYSYMYTFQMPQVIHSLVDKYMNCEDIAMNFLVAHLTRKPPVKVTSRWTFHCAGCSSSLSEDDSHFRERHECLNTFTSVYGYMPLLNTQHRSDSVLFKTKLPQDKQKCFKFV